MGLRQTDAHKPCRIGLLGGSFDPIHYAHLELAKAARHHLVLDRVEFLPAAAPWQRAPLGASPTQRLDMLRLAIEGMPATVINTLEIDRGGPTYTVDTLRALKAGEHTETRYFWVLGGDQLFFYLQRDSSSRASGGALTQGGMQYRWLF